MRRRPHLRGRPGRRLLRRLRAGRPVPGLSGGRPAGATPVRRRAVHRGPGGGDPARPFRAQAAADRLRVQSLLDGPVQEPGEEVAGVGGERHRQRLPRLHVVAGGPGHPARQGERGRRVLTVGADAAAGERPPEPERGLRLASLHPLRRPVPGGAVLQAEDQRRGLLVGEELVVPEVRVERIGPRRFRRVPAVDPRRQFHGPLRHRRAAVRLDEARQQRGSRLVQRGLLGRHRRGPLPGAQPHPHLPQRATHSQPGVGRRGGQHRGAGKARGSALRRAAGLVRAAVGPVAPAGEAQRLDHRHVELSALRAQQLGQRPQAFHDGAPGPAGRGLLAHVGDHPGDRGAPAGAAGHQAEGELPGGGLPLRGVGRDAEPGPATEPSVVPRVVQGHQHHAVLRPVTEQVGQGVGEVPGAAQGDLLEEGISRPATRSPVRHVSG